MNNRKHEGVRRVGKGQPKKSRRWLFVLVLAAALIIVAAAWPARLARADQGGAQGHTFQVTFTKWVTSEPASPPSAAGVSMAGVVGGDVGDGQYVGTVLSDDLVSEPGFWLGHAQYEFHGEKHTFIADVHVRENDTIDPPTAEITGVITSGWLKGAHLAGEYTVMAVCPIATPGNVFGSVCFQGTIQIQRGHWSEE